MSYYDTRLGIVNNWALPSSTSGWSAIDNYALNSVFTNFFNNFSANAAQTANNANLSTISNPFSFGNLASNWSFPQTNWSLASTSSGGDWLSNAIGSLGSLGSWGTQGGGFNSGSVDAPAFLSQNNKDKIFGSGKIQPLDKDMQRAVIEFMKRAHAKGINIEINEGFCSSEERTRRYNEAVAEGKGRDVRYAKPGKSQHIFGKAIDIRTRNFSQAQLDELRKIWRDDMGFTYGMDFKAYRENWHFDMRPDIRYNRGMASTWLGKGGQSTYASGGYPSPWGGGMNWSMPVFSSSMGGFGSGFGGSWINTMFSSSLGGWGGGYSSGGGTNFDRGLRFVLNREGGLANNANDKGGLTNKGITHTTYNNWRRRHGLPMQSVAKITQEEANKIYYESYWIPSGAANISDSRMAIAVFDSAVNMGVGTAKQLYQQSGGDLNRFIQLRKQRYIAIVEKDPSQRVFLNRWLQRSEVSASV